MKLHVGYPHIVASLERGQVERVIQRQRDVEALMDSPLAGTRDDEREQGVDAHARAPKSAPARQPFGELSFLEKRGSIHFASVDTARAVADKTHYLAWYKALRCRLGERDWYIEGEGNMVRDAAQIPRRATLILQKQQRQHEIEWDFDAALRRYIITLASPPWSSDVIFSGGERKRIVGRERMHQTFVRLLVPTPDEGIDDSVVSSLIDLLEGSLPSANLRAQAYWGDAFSTLPDGDVSWDSDHKARLTIKRGDRTQRVAVYAYEGSVRVISVVAATPDAIAHRDGWQRPPSAEDLRKWTLDANNELPLGYLDWHERDGLVFGIHVLHGNLSVQTRRRLLEEVAWRADAWEASLTGVDRQ